MEALLGMCVIVNVIQSVLSTLMRICTTPAVTNSQSHCLVPLAFSIQTQSQSASSPFDHLVSPSLICSWKYCNILFNLNPTDKSKMKVKVRILIQLIKLFLSETLFCNEFPNLLFETQVHFQPYFAGVDDDIPLRLHYMDMVPSFNFPSIEKQAKLWWPTNTKSLHWSRIPCLIIR